MMPPGLVESDPRLRAAYHWPIEKQPGRKRIVFLGGSTSQPDDGRSYPERTVALLNAAAGTDAFECVNMGMSSYSTHQSLMALERNALPRNPDCVVVYHGWNDAMPAEQGIGDAQRSLLCRGSQIMDVVERRAGWLGRLRLTQALGRLVDAFRPAGGRPRVGPDEFMANLRKMAELCAGRGIPLVIVGKPKADDLSGIQGAWPGYTNAWSAMFGTNISDIYYGTHRLYAGIQAQVAASRPGVRLADAEARLDRAQRELAAAPHEAVSIFMTDKMHLNSLGNQFLAEAVAEAIAPELTPRLREYASSAGYWRDRALEFQRMDSPFECDWAVDRAVALDPGMEAELAPVREWARAQYEFWRIYQANFWIGFKRGELGEALPNLIKCLRMRPSDFGVAQQIHRVCMYLGRPDMALDGLLEFKPANQRDEYRWLGLVMDSAAHRGDAARAKWAAESMLKINPNDATAADMLRRIRGL